VLINTRSHEPLFLSGRHGNLLSARFPFPGGQSQGEGWSKVNKATVWKPALPSVRNIFNLKEGYVLDMRQPRYSEIFAGHDEGETLAEMARVLWAEYKADLVGRGLFTAARGRTLDRLVRAQAEYLLLYPQAVAGGPSRVAESGGEYFSYVWSAVQKLDDRISKLEKALALTPESVGAKGEIAKKVPQTAADEFLNMGGARKEEVNFDV
jgi:hypothetical protein